MTRTVCAVTVGRSDYGIYRPILRRIERSEGLKLQLIAAGMHWIDKFGYTAKEIEKDGFKISARVDLPLDSDLPEAISSAMGVATERFADCYNELKPDILLVLGDRFEMHSASMAAVPFKIPIAHIHGGEITLGAIDNVFRFSITMASHLHFVATEEYAKRVRQLGEEPWRVIVSGAPALDEIKTMQCFTREEIEDKFNIKLDPKPIIVTFHPVTLEFEKTERQIDQLMQALEYIGSPVIFTAPNADTSNKIIWGKIDSFIKRNQGSYLVKNFGSEYYFSMLSFSSAMVGNSSSGLLEAPSFKLPAVNIGSRQEGRIRAKNVIDVGYSSGEIISGLKKALSPEFRKGLEGTVNPYGNGRASEIIVDYLQKVELGGKLLRKSFCDI